MLPPELWRRAAELAVELHAVACVCRRTAPRPGRPRDRAGARPARRAAARGLACACGGFRWRSASSSSRARPEYGAKLRMVLRELFPTPAFMRWWTPLARRGRAGLALPTSGGCSGSPATRSLRFGPGAQPDAALTTRLVARRRIGGGAPTSTLNARRSTSNRTLSFNRRAEAEIGSPRDRGFAWGYAKTSGAFDCRVVGAARAALAGLRASSAASGTHAQAGCITTSRLRHHKPARHRKPARRRKPPHRRHSGAQLDHAQLTRSTPSRSSTCRSGPLAVASALAWLPRHAAASAVTNGLGINFNLVHRRSGRADGGGARARRIPPRQGWRSGGQPRSQPPEPVHPVPRRTDAG